MAVLIDFEEKDLIQFGENYTEFTDSEDSEVLIRFYPAQDLAVRWVPSDQYWQQMSDEDKEMVRMLISDAPAPVDAALNKEMAADAPAPVAKQPAPKAKKYAALKAIAVTLFITAAIGGLLYLFFPKQSNS